MRAGDQELRTEWFSVDRQRGNNLEEPRPGKKVEVQWSRPGPRTQIPVSTPHWPKSKGKTSRTTSSHFRQSLVQRATYE